ncbi:PAS domain-containing sensor histidine kinase [Salinibaculum salinum]|uniref:PAS domain-containing protein n=1 Tax=Salinibaculum salinum TaxID=3131996 RepID=UPI0030EE879C
MDSDAESWKSLASFVEGCDDIVVERVSDGGLAREVVRRGDIDVVVTTESVPSGPGDPLLETATPTVLYTAEDPWNIDDRVLGGTDSLVEKGIAGSERYLVEKIRGMVSGALERDDFSVDALARMGDDLNEEVGIFLLDERGSVLWSSRSLESLFAMEECEQSATRCDDFYARIAELLADQPEALSAILGLRDTGDGETTQLVEIEGQQAVQQFLHATYPIPTLPTGSRLVVFLPLTAVVDQYEHLELFEELVDNAEDGLYILDADGRIEYCNHSYAGIVGYEPDELVGKHVSMLIAAGEIESGQEAVNRALAGDDSGVVDMTLRHRDGSEIHTAIHGSVRRDSTGSYAGVMGVVRDITERKERERELEEYRTLAENAVDPMYVLDKKGDIQIVNKALREFVGQTTEQLVGANASDVFPVEGTEAGRNGLMHILSDDATTSDSFEMWMTGADGTERLFEVTISAIIEDGEFAGSVGTFRDITERHTRQQQLDLRKQIFARSLRHNIRNETSIIHSYGSILADELEGRHAEMATAILDASQSLAETSRKVSQFDWLVEKEAEMVEHDLCTLAKRCIEQVRATNDAADIEVAIPDGTRVRAVRDLDLAVRNLVENALQHSTDSDPPTVTVTATVETETVRLVVADDGPGIPRQEVEVIEEGKETALDHASGLGLWLVKRVVTQSGGELSFEVEDGTRAHVRLRRPRGE